MGKTGLVVHICSNFEVNIFVWFVSMLAKCMTVVVLQSGVRLFMSAI